MWQDDLLTLITCPLPFQSEYADCYKEAQDKISTFRDKVEELQYQNRTMEDQIQQQECQLKNQTDTIKHYKKVRYVSSRTRPTPPNTTKRYSVSTQEPDGHHQTLQKGMVYLLKNQTNTIKHYKNV